MAAHFGVVWFNPASLQKQSKNLGSATFQQFKYKCFKTAACRLQGVICDPKKALEVLGLEAFMLSLLLGSHPDDVPQVRKCLKFCV